MRTHSERRRVLHSADDVFGLVSEVAAYPDFIPFIRAMRVLKDVRRPDGLREVTAEALIGYKLIRERFTSAIRIDKARRSVDVALVDGPFRALENRWRFAPLPDGSAAVELHLAFQFKNPILQRLLEANYDRAVSAIAGAFERAADARLARAGDPKADAAQLLASVEPALE